MQNLILILGKLSTHPTIEIFCNPWPVWSVYHEWASFSNFTRQCQMTYWTQFLHYKAGVEHDMWVKLLSMKIFWSESYSFKNTFNFLAFNNLMVCPTLNSLENPSGNPEISYRFSSNDRMILGLGIEPVNRWISFTQKGLLIFWKRPFLTIMTEKVRFL